MAVCISPQEVEEDGNDEIGSVIQNRRHPLIALAEMLRQHGRRKRNRSYTQQKKKVQKQKRIIRSLDVSEQAMVIDPHNPDEGETKDKGKIRGPLPEKLDGELSAASSRNLDFQNQQSNSNGKNAVREGFDARRFFFHEKPLDLDAVVYRLRAFFRAGPAFGGRFTIGATSSAVTNIGSMSVGIPCNPSSAFRTAGRMTPNSSSIFFAPA